jgi:signal transduction histidine kinase
MTSFEAYVTEQNSAAVRLACLLGITLMPAGIVLDLLTSQHFVGEFLILRLIAAGICLAFLGLSRVPSMRKHNYALGVAVMMTMALSIEIMTVRQDPAHSPYYAGLNLCILGAGLTFLWSGRQSLWAALVVLLLWLVPALWTRPTLYGPFFNNLYFLVLTGIIAVAANHMRYNLARREFEARMALARTSAELQASLERIRELDRLKSQFFSNISHELRTPLTLITAPLQELLHRGLPPETSRGTLQVILRNALRLRRLIDGIFDLARLEEGRLRLRVTTLDIRTLVQGVVAAFQPAADTMGIKLRLEVQQGDKVVLGDADQLEVVLTNLLGNALKFTDRGGSVLVRVGEEEGGMVLEVADTGPGIPEAEQPYIFERFRRVESPGRKQEGAGIGLALVKELVELHGGTVQVRSSPAQGASFLVRLPAGGPDKDKERDREVAAEAQRAQAQPAPAEEETPSRPDLSPVLLLSTSESMESSRPVPRLDVTEVAPAPETGLDEAGQRPARVLIAEDNADMRRFLRDLLGPIYQVTVVGDGQAAWEALHRDPPDLLLADVMMPHLSGIELCHKIKADPQLRGVPVILLTARGGIDETLEGFAHGADDYLAKPFNPRELLMRVAVQLRLRRLAAQVANNARLAAVGTLAAGVAHEIKNPLNAIGTGVAALRRRPDVPPALRAEVMEVIEECVARIADITTALTDHARPADGEGVSLCDLRLGLDSTTRLLGERLRQAGVQVVREYQSSRRVAGRARQLNQVFLNLLDNALRASPPGGQIRLRIEDRGPDWVVVRVRDQGAGIERGVQERIFDPFYTTRPPGEGTGLGLYLSRQIIESHGGVLRVESTPEQGTEFVVELPVGGVQAQTQGAAA